MSPSLASHLHEGPDRDLSPEVTVNSEARIRLKVEAITLADIISRSQLASWDSALFKYCK